MRLFPLVTLSALSILALSACRSDGHSGNPPPQGNRDGGTPPAGDCPGQGTTVCAVKLASSSRHPAAGGPVSLSGVVITTPTITITKDRVTGVVTLASFYVQDPSGATYLDGRYSGVAITYKPADLVGMIPAGGPASCRTCGQVVNIEGVYAEFGQMGFPMQKQVQASRIDGAGPMMAIDPITVDSPANIGAGGPDEQAYEGVLVKVQEVTVQQGDTVPANSPCSNKGPASVVANGSQICGAFRIDPTLIVSGTMYEYRNAQVGEQFSSIAGVLRVGTAPFDAGSLLLTPRTAADLAPKNAASVVHSIAGIQDPTSPDKPLESCSNPNGNMVVGKCATADLKRVVVTGVAGYVSTNLRAIFVQDPNDQDGHYAGVKVVYNPNTTPWKPTRGMYIDVTGEIIEYRGSNQIQFPMLSRNGTDTATVTPTVVANLGDLARDQPTSRAYEGTLVRLQNVDVTTRCTEDTQQRDHGYFLVGPNVEIGSMWEDSHYNGDPRPGTVACLDQDQMPTGLCSCTSMSRPNDMRHQGDHFTSITGIVDFAFSEYKVEPRNDGDLVR